MVHAGLERRDGDAFGPQALDESVVGASHRVGGELPLGGRRLVRRDRQHVAGRGQGPHALDRPREEPELVGVKRDRDGAGLLVSNDVDDGSVAIEDRDCRHFTLSHFVGMRWSFGWLTSRCHTTAAKPSVCGVIRSLATVGMRTHASEACLV